MRHFIKSKNFHAEGWGIITLVVIVVAGLWLNHDIWMAALKYQ